MGTFAPHRLVTRLPHLPRLSALVAWILVVLLMLAWLGLWHPRAF